MDEDECGSDEGSSSGTSLMKTNSSFDQNYTSSKSIRPASSSSSSSSIKSNMDRNGNTDRHQNDEDTLLYTNASSVIEKCSQFIDAFSKMIPSFTSPQSSSNSEELLSLKTHLPIQEKLDEMIRQLEVLRNSFIYTNGKSSNNTNSINNGKSMKKRGCSTSISNQGKVSLSTKLRLFYSLIPHIK